MTRPVSGSGVYSINRMGRQIVTLRMPFGKHRGEPIEQVLADANYCAWLLRQAWLAETYPRLHQALSQEQVTAQGVPPDRDPGAAEMPNFADWTSNMAILARRLGELPRRPGATEPANAHEIGVDRLGKMGWVSVPSIC
jgi:uncharacterized protein (DUF3820 family)